MKNTQTWLLGCCLLCGSGLLCLQVEVASCGLLPLDAPSVFAGHGDVRVPWAPLHSLKSSPHFLAHFAHQCLETGGVSRFLGRAVSKFSFAGGDIWNQVSRHLPSYLQEVTSVLNAFSFSMHFLPSPWALFALLVTVWSGSSSSSNLSCNMEMASWHARNSSASYGDALVGPSPACAGVWCGVSGLPGPPGLSQPGSGWALNTSFPPLTAGVHLPVAHVGSSAGCSRVRATWMPLG